MRHLKLLVWLPLAAICSGCVVQSLYSLGDEKTIVQDRRMMGTWEVADDESTVVTFSRHPDHLGWSSPYLVRIVNSDGASFSFQTTLVKLGESYYLDMIPEDKEKPFALLTLHPHRILRLTFKDDRVIMQDCNMDKIQAILKDKPELLKFDKIEGKLVLMSKTPELQEFFKTFGNQIYVERGTVLKRRVEQKPQEAAR